jgi:hypothetical protein
MSKQDTVGIAPQSGLFTEATTVAYGPTLTAQGGGLNRAEMSLDEMLGSRAPTKQEYGLRSAQPSMSGALRPVSSGLVLASFFGAPTSTQPDGVNAPTVYRHVYDEADVLYPVPLSIWGTNKDRMLDESGNVLPSVTTKYKGAVGNTLQLSCELNNYLLFEGGYVALGVDPNAAEPSITRDTSGKWPFKNVTAEVSIAGSALGPLTLRSFTFNLNQNLIDDQGRLGSAMLDDIPLGPEIESTLTITALRNIPYYYREAFEDNPDKIRIKLTATGPTIQGAFAYTFELDLPYCELGNVDLSRSGSETLRSVEVPFRVILDDATGKLLTATLTNATDGALYREPAAA